eukprot:GHVN01001266.1.p1 GENE.GHVN01001266.1~~GHVN01001266.1.p1  ORF type:complete len:1024 (-),score=96.80 GHVN01001266.1:118-3189(-)
MLMVKIMINHYLPEWLTDHEEISTRRPQRLSSSGQTTSYRLPKPHPLVEFLLSLTFSPPMACLIFSILLDMRRLDHRDSSSPHERKQVSSPSSAPATLSWQDSLRSSWDQYSEEIVILTVELVTKIYRKHDPETPTCLSAAAEIGLPKEKHSEGPCCGEQPHIPRPLPIMFSTLAHFHSHYLLFHTPYSTLIRSGALPNSPLVNRHSSQASGSTASPSEAWSGLEGVSPSSHNSIDVTSYPPTQLLLNSGCKPNPLNQAKLQNETSMSQSPSASCSLIDVLSLFPSLAFMGFQGYGAQRVNTHESDNILKPVGSRVCGGMNLTACSLICLRDVLRCYLPSNLTSSEERARCFRERDWASVLKNIMAQPGPESTKLTDVSGEQEGRISMLVGIARVVRKWFEVIMLKDSPHSSTPLRDRATGAVSSSSSRRPHSVPPSRANTPSGDSEGHTAGRHTAGREPITVRQAPATLPDLSSLSGHLPINRDRSRGDERNTSGDAALFDVPNAEEENDVAAFLTESTLLRIIRKKLYTLHVSEINSSTDQLAYKLSNLRVTDFQISQCRVCLQTVGKSFKAASSTEQRLTTHPPRTSNSGAHGSEEFSAYTTEAAQNDSVSDARLGPLLNVSFTPPPCPRVSVSPVYLQPLARSPSAAPSSPSSQSGMTNNRDRALSTRALSSVSITGDVSRLTDGDDTSTVFPSPTSFGDTPSSSSGAAGSVSSVRTSGGAMNGRKPSPSNSGASELSRPRPASSQPTDASPINGLELSAAHSQTPEWRVTESFPQIVTETSNETYNAPVNELGEYDDHQVQFDPSSRLASRFNDSVEDNRLGNETMEEVTPRRISNSPQVESPSPKAGLEVDEMPPSNTVTPLQRGGSKAIHFRVSTDRLAITLAHDWSATVSMLRLKGSSLVQVSNCEVIAFISLSMEKGFHVHNVTIRLPTVDICLTCSSSLPQLLLSLIVPIFKETLRSYMEENLKRVLTQRAEKLCEWWNHTIWRRIQALIPEGLLSEFLEFVDYSIPPRGIFV